MWQIRPSEETKEWAEELAFILGTRSDAGKALPRLFLERLDFRQREGLDPRSWFDASRIGDIPQDGWSVRALPDIVICCHPEWDNAVCGLRDVRDREQRLEQMRCAMLPLYERVTQWGGLPLHAALAEFDQQGVLLAGKGGAGKSTCCTRLPFSWGILADDIALAMPDRDGGFRAHPLPTWSALKAGQIKWPCQSGRSIPLRAMFFLEQGGTDEIAPLGGGVAALHVQESSAQVFRSILPGFGRSGFPPLNRSLFENAASLARHVPAYVLRVSITGPFWELIEGVLSSLSGDFDRGPVSEEGRINDPAPFGQTARWRESKRE